MTRIKKLFKNAFHSTRTFQIPDESQSNDLTNKDGIEEDSCASDEVNSDKLNQIAKSIDRLTEFSRLQESFSSISNFNDRHQFVTAFNNIHNALTCQANAQNGIIRKKSPSHTDSSSSSPIKSTTITVQYPQIISSTMQSDQHNVSQSHNHSNSSTEENMIDFDTPIDELTNVHTSQSPSSNVHHQNQPQQLLLSEMNRENPLTSESLSSHDSEDSNGFIRVDEPFIDPLLSEFDDASIPFDAKFHDTSMTFDKVEHDITRDLKTPSDETSSLSSDMDQHHILPKASDLAESAFEKVSDTAASGYDKVSDMVTAGGDATRSAFDSIAEATKKAEEKGFAAAQNVFGTVADSAKSVAEKVSTGVHDTLQQAEGISSDTSSWLAASSRPSADATTEQSTNLLGDTVQLLDDKTSAAYDSIKTASNNAFNTVTDQTAHLYGDIAKGAEDTKHDFYDAFGKAPTKAEGLIEKGVGELSGFAGGVKQKADEAAELLKEGADKVYEAGKEAVHVVDDKRHDVTDKAYEVGHKLEEKGGDMIEAVERRVEDEYDRLTDAVQTQYDASKNVFGDRMEGVENVAHSLYEKSSDAVRGGAQAVGGMLETGYEKIKSEDDDAFKKASGGEHPADLFDTAYDTVKDTTHSIGATAQKTVESAMQAAMGEGHTPFQSKASSHQDDHSMDMFDPLKKTTTQPQSDQAKIQVPHEDKIQLQTGGVFGRGASPDEQTFDRKGPLTIPSAPQPKQDDSFVYLDDEQKDDERFGGIAPRPPTPPKELDDEDVKPTTIDVGPRPPYKTSIASDRPRSILKHVGQGPWFDFKTIDPKLMDLIYWRDPKKSGIVLGSIVILLLVFATYPLISVLSYLGLAVLGGTLGFRLYKIAEAQLKKNDGSNPFQPYLEKEVSVPQERVHQQVDVLVEYGQWTFDKLKRLFLVENIAESAKFGLLLWAMTYVGSWFSGLCILLLVVIGVFTIPKVYDTYQEPIDQNLAKVKEQVDKANKMMNEKVPFLKKFTGTVEQHEKST